MKKLLFYKYFFGVSGLILMISACLFILMNTNIINISLYNNLLSLIIIIIVSSLLCLWFLSKYYIAYKRILATYLEQHYQYSYEKSIEEMELSKRMILFKESDIITYSRNVIKKNDMKWVYVASTNGLSKIINSLAKLFIPYYHFNLLMRFQKHIEGDYYLFRLKEKTQFSVYYTNFMKERDLCKNIDSHLTKYRNEQHLIFTNQDRSSKLIFNQRFFNLVNKMNIKIAICIKDYTIHIMLKNPYSFFKMNFLMNVSKKMRLNEQLHLNILTIKKELMDELKNLYLEEQTVI